MVYRELQLCGGKKREYWLMHLIPPEGSEKPVTVTVSGKSRVERDLFSLRTLSYAFKK